MNAHDNLVAQIAQLMEQQAEAAAASPEPSREEKIRAGYEEVLKHKPDMLYSDFLKEVIEEERRNCLYLQRMSEGKHKGIAYDLDVLKDTRFIMDMASKSKYALLPSEAWSMIVGNDAFANLFDPNHKMETLAQGYLGVLFNCEFYTAAFTSQELLKNCPESNQVLFVIHEEFRSFFNPDTKRFEIDGVPDAEAIERREAEDRHAVESCPFMQHLPHALEHGVLSHVDIFNGKHNKQLERLLESSQYALIPSRAWAHIIGSNDFATLVTPITDYNLALDGDLGVLGGCRLYTDGFLAPHLKDRSQDAQTRVIFVPRETE